MSKASRKGKGIEYLREEVERLFIDIDSVGTKIRKLKKRNNSLKAKHSLTSAEYREMSSNDLLIHNLEIQRKDIAALESSLNPANAKLLKISKAYDKVSEQYDSGKMDASLFVESLRKIQRRFNEINEPAVSGMNVTVYQRGTITHNLGHALEQAFAAVIVIFILIPALFACSGH